MQDSRKQYVLEMQQRYLKFLQQEDAKENQVRERHMPVTEVQKKTREKGSRRRVAAVVDEPEISQLSAAPIQKYKPDTSQLSMDRYLPSSFRVQNIIIDSSLRDTNIYPSANEFVVRLIEPLKNVAAIRLMKTEFFQPSNSIGYFVINQARVPLQLYDIDNAYLYLNGYISTSVANDTNTAFFGRIGPGVEMYPSVTSNLTQDPHMYLLKPADPRLRKFHVKLLNHDGSLYPLNNAKVVLTLAVYCLE